MIWTFVGCGLGTLALSFLLRAPKKALLPGMVMGLLAFGLYHLALSWGATEHAAVFLGGFAGALGSEICARRMQMAALVFITPSLIPLVPGLGLYRTMVLAVQDELTAAAALGADTAVVFGLLALAVASATLGMRLFASFFRGKGV